MIAAHPPCLKAVRNLPYPPSNSSDPRPFSRTRAGVVYGTASASLLARTWPTPRAAKYNAIARLWQSMSTRRGAGVCFLLGPSQSAPETSDFQPSVWRFGIPAAVSTRMDPAFWTMAHLKRHIHLYLTPPLSASYYFMHYQTHKIPCTARTKPT